MWKIIVNALLLLVFMLVVVPITRGEPKVVAKNATKVMPEITPICTEPAFFFGGRCIAPTAQGEPKVVAKTAIKVKPEITPICLKPAFLSGGQCVLSCPRPLTAAYGQCVSQTQALASECDPVIPLQPNNPDHVMQWPQEATEIEASELVDEDLGLLSNLYPDLDTTTDDFYSKLPCEPSVDTRDVKDADIEPYLEPLTKDQLEADQYINKFETTTGKNILGELLTIPKPPISKFKSLKKDKCYIVKVKTSTSPESQMPVPCNDSIFLDSNMPFEGRDIIYVHGFKTQHLKDKINNQTGPASKVWPQDAAEFLNTGGYFRDGASSYWAPHITEHLSSGWQWTSTDSNGPRYASKSNRYLVVAWSTNQTIEYAQHTFLTQIQLAITTNMNVVTPFNYPSKFKKPFCANGCIVISHSTGSLITSSAMGLAKTGVFGPGGVDIANHVVAHVSFDGAISGSRIASIALAIASAGQPSVVVSNVLCKILDTWIGISNTCNNDVSFFANSVLRDLVPLVSQGVWGTEVNKSPVPTVTFAGGHPDGNGQSLFGLTKPFLPGVDEGVVTMNSACGNPSAVFPYVTPPSGLKVWSLWKAFEFSENASLSARGLKTMVGQKNLLQGLPGGTSDPRYLASACTPYLSASGMVLPVTNTFSGTPNDARKRYANHFSFIQSIAEHSYDGGGSTPNAWPSSTNGSANALREYAPYPISGINLEESRAVTDSAIYTKMIDSNGTHLVKPLDMHVIQRGRKIRFKMPFNIGNCKKQGSGLLKWNCQTWVWKRTYNLADKWEKKQSSHYAYEFVGRR